MYYPGGVKGAMQLTDDSGAVTWDIIRTRIPFLLFGIVFLVVTVLTFIRNYSLIPVLGFLSCSYLLSESGVTNWERFMIWLILGLVVYFVYGARHSRLGDAERKTASDE
jgi:APA family basic amino acid/polyamine antiporter